MNRKPRGGFTSDDGMSVVEVVIAAFILFYVLTAIIGLVWTTTQMGVNAKQRNAVTNAMTSHMEWVRSLDFAEVALQGTEVSATIPAQRTIVVEGYTIVVTTSVTEGTTGIKEVSVTAVATAPGQSPMTMSQHASIRDYKAALRTESTLNEGPVVSFGTSTPAADTVLYSGYYGNNSLLYIDARAQLQSVNPEAVISELKFTCSGNLLRDGSSVHANVALWQPMVVYVNQRFRWNTEQVDDQGNPAAIPDGWRIVRVEAMDNEGNPPVAAERRFLVDNYAPNPPTEVVSQVMTANEARLGWVSARDGTDDAWEYGVKLQRVGSTGELVLLNPLDAYENPIDFKLSPSAFIHSATNPPAAPAQPFSRYLAHVRAYSPRLLTSEYAEVLPIGYASGSTKAYVTRALVSATSYTIETGKWNQGNRAATTYVNGSVTPPTFGCSTLRYDLYRGTSATNLALYRSDTTATFTESIYRFLGASTQPPPTYYYRYKVTYRALGTTAGTADEVMWSNIIGPTNTTETSLSMPHVSW